MVQVAVEEDQVARLEVGAGDAGAGVPLGLGDARQLDPGRAVGGAGEAGAVVAGRAGGAPDVRLAELGVGELDHGGGPSGDGAGEGGPLGGGAGGAGGGGLLGVDLGPVGGAQLVEQRLGLGQLVLDRLLLARERGGRLVELGEGGGRLGAVLVEPALLGQGLAQQGRLRVDDLVLGGGPGQVGAGVGVEHQLDGRVDAAVAVLVGRDGAELGAQFVHRVLAPGHLLLDPARLALELLLLLLEAVVALDRLLGLLVEPVDLLLHGGEARRRLGLGRSRGEDDAAGHRGGEDRQTGPAGRAGLAAFSHGVRSPGGEKGRSPGRKDRTG